MNKQKLPPITLHPEDRERLEALALASLDRFPQTAGYLAREVERARIVGANDDTPFVRMGSLVTFRDDTTGQVREVTLTYPDRADIAAGRVSVLTPESAVDPRGCGGIASSANASATRSKYSPILSSLSSTAL